MSLCHKLWFSNVADLRYFKLWILLDQLIWVWNIKGLQHRALKILRFKCLILFQRLNSFDYCLRIKYCRYERIGFFLLKLIQILFLHYQWSCTTLCKNSNFSLSWALPTFVQKLFVKCCKKYDLKSIFMRNFVQKNVCF